MRQNPTFRKIPPLGSDILWFFLNSPPPFLNLSFIFPTFPEFVSTFSWFLPYPTVSWNCPSHLVHDIVTTFLKQIILKLIDYVLEIDRNLYSYDRIFLWQSEGLNPKPVELNLVLFILAKISCKTNVPSNVPSFVPLRVHILLYPTLQGVHILLFFS